MDTLQNQTVIPVAAIQRGASGTFVFIVNPDKTVNQRSVKLGVQDGDKVAILDGLKPGDTVVVDGADRLRDGSEVLIPNPGQQKIAQPSGAAADAARTAARAKAQAVINKRLRRRYRQALLRPDRSGGATLPGPESRFAVESMQNGAGVTAATGRWRRRSSRALIEMSPSAPFILRPVATSLLMIAIMLVGMAGYRFLPLSALPEVDYPTIQVSSFYPGASPDVMTTSVTAILERQFGQMPGLKEMSSVSSAGSSIITLQFDLTLSLDVAEQEVQAAINAGGKPAAAAARSAGLRQGQSRRRAGDHAGDHLAQPAHHHGRGSCRHPHRPENLAAGRRWPGEHFGAQRPAVRVQANLQQLASYGLNIDDLRTTINNNNSNAPKGSFDGAFAVLHHQRQRSAAERRRLRQHGRRLQERRAGASVGRGDRGAGRGERQARRAGRT